MQILNPKLHSLKTSSYSKYSYSRDERNYSYERIKGLIYLSPFFVISSIFSLTILLGIFTTSVPLLWTVSSRFVEEKTSKFNIITITLGVLGVIIAMFVNFDVLVNYVYVISGYVGFALILIMLWQDIRKLIRKNRQ